MAEPANGGDGKSQGQPPKELSMEVRLLLAFLLMGVVMLATNYLPWFKTAPPPKPPETAAVTPSGPAGQPSQPEAAQPTPAAPQTSSAPASPATSQDSLPVLTIETDVFKVSFSNQGGTVRSWVLKAADKKGNYKYRGNDGKPLDLINPASHPPCPPNAPCLDAPFSLYFPGQQPSVKVNSVNYAQTLDTDGLGVAYMFSDGHTTVRKTFRFEKTSYLSQVSSDVTIDGRPVAHMLQWRGGFGDFTIAAPADKTLSFDVNANSFKERTASDAKNGPVTVAGNFSFAGLADGYFAAVFLPEGGNTQFVTFSDQVRTPAEEKPQAFAGAAITDGESNHFELFVGPKDVDLLKSINPKLEQVVDFGWLSVLAKPLFLLVNWFNDHAVHNFGWSIVVVTIAINFLLFPLKFTNMKSMRKMQALKPHIDVINAKYKNVKMTDPRAGEKNQEVMDLYKKHGVNPMGGCFPMLLQLPFFFAFYKVFTVSVEMRGASWLWVTDLSQPETLAIRILPLIMIATQFLMQQMTPQPNADPSQQKMMKFMPLIFGFMFYRFPSGLVLYYLTSNLVQIAQQWFFNTTGMADQAAGSVAPPKKKNGRK
ncbi:MAG TPA: membrane protein insertase YidC [Bryobacteraceae bacterium]|nr:membrane protein insertase YidC [Bryobacteraceae bacterium]